MKRPTRFVLLTLGYLAAVARVGGRRFKNATKIQRRKLLATSMVIVAAMGVFVASSANAANELGYNSTIDYSLAFNGTNPITVVDSGTAPTDFTTNFTVEAWIKPGACTAGRCMISNKENSWEWSVYNGVIEYAIVTNLGNWDWIQTGARVPSNRWSHVVWVKSGTALRFYVDGALAEDGRTTGQTTTASNGPFTIGGREGTADRFVGEIDEVKLWNTARTASQIAVEMHSYGDGIGPNYLDDSSLVGYYDFNEGTNAGTQIFDRTTNAKHVVVVSGATKPTYSDVKTFSILGGDNLYTFPRSYITPVGGWTPPTDATRARVLVVAGGGGGGPGQSSGWQGAGGGAGGMRDIPGAAISGPMKITVGQGGFAAPSGASFSSSPGQDSYFGAESSVGGGGGLYWNFTGQGQNGGSGSGAMMFGGGSYSAAALGGTGIPGQGYPGGKNVTGSASTNNYASGGGGGAGSAGGDASAATGGAAGNGAPSDISGVNTYYAGGGAGAGYTNQGAANTAFAATPVGTTPSANTGSGGAGGRQSAVAPTSGASGAVIVRYSPQVDKYWSRSSATEAMYVMSSGGPIPTATTDSLTVEAWIKPTSQSSGFYGIMSQQSAVGNGYGSTRMYLGLNNRQIHFALGGVNYTANAQVPDNAWSHVGVTVTGTTVKVYVDAQLTYSSNAWTRSSLGSYFTLGGSAQTDEADWLGGLDQVKIWTVALSADELRASMNAYQAPSSGSATLANLKVHYDFNELSSAGALLDRSSTGSYTDISTGPSSPALTENIETSSKANSRTAIRFTRNYLTAAGGWTVPSSAGRVDALVVAGGGGGGAHVGAGGGAGGFVEKPYSLSPGSVIAIQVGQGGGGSVMREGTWATADDGAPFASRLGSNGNDSILGTSVTATGGGRGGRWYYDGYLGQSGGSSGGSVYSVAAVAGTPGQGNAGGTASGANESAYGAYVTGGGGGAGGVGGSPTGTTQTSGAGGVGKTSNLWADGTYYAGGGGGGFTGWPGYAGAGGLGGGGTGTGYTTTATPFAPGHGAANTGGGGGGGGAHSTTNLSSWGGNGGSGVIVLSYGGYLDLSNTPKARRAQQQFDVAPIIRIKKSDGSPLSGASHTVTVTTGTIGNLTFNGTALSAGKEITASDGVFDFTGLGFATGVTTAQVLTFSSPDFVDYQVTVAPKFSPTSVQIVADSAAVSTAGFFDSTGQFNADAEASTNIRISDLNTALASTDVRIDATGTISVDTAANTSASSRMLTLVAGSTLTISTGNSLRTGGATNLTGTSVTINGPLTTSGTTLIYSSSTSGLNTIAADVKNLALNARTTFKSVGANSNTTAATIQTNKGPLVFWADSDGNAAGYNRTQNGSIFNTVNGVSTDTATDGGDMVFAGGSTLDASDYPSSYSWADGSYSGFDSGYGNTNKTYFFTGGGKFIVRGGSANGLDAIAFQSAVQVWANLGQIEITGNNTGTGLAIQIQRGGTTTQSEFFSSSGTSPAIAFSAIANSGYGLLTGNNLSTSNVINIQATGSGGIDVIGDGGGSDVFDIGINSTNLLSSGPITLTTRGAGVNGGLFPGRLFNNYASTFSTLGYCAVATCTGSRVTTTNANITVTTDRMASWDSDVNLKVNTKGTATFRPIRATGFHEFKALGQGLAFSEDCTGVTIGKDQSTDTFDMSFYPNVKIDGPIRLYGGRVSIYGNLESTRAGSEIRAKSNGSVYLYVSKTVKTKGGDVVFWSSADKVAGTTQVEGTIWLENSSSIKTLGGKIWLAGGIDDGGADALITTSRGKWDTVVSGDALPDGYAVGYNRGDEWAIGVYLDVSVTLSSDGGDIFMAGGLGPTSGIGYGHILVQPGVKIDSGIGRIAMWGRSPVGSNTGTQGIALNYGNDSNPVLITSHASTSDAIALYSDSSDGSGSWSRGITSAWYSAWDNARGHSGLQIVASNTGGGISLTGIGGGGASSSDAVGIRLDYTDILAKSGPITINGMSSSSASSQGLSVGRDSGGNSAVRIGGWQAGTTGAVGGGLITTSQGVMNLTSSSSPININVDSIYNFEGGKGTIFGTTGAVQIMPISYTSGIATAADNFKRAQTDAQWRFGTTSFPVRAASFTLAKPSTTTDISYYGDVSTTGAITMYGGTVKVAGSLNSSTLDARIVVKAKASIGQIFGSTFRTNSGKIVLWSDSDSSGGGNMAIAGTLCTAPTATTCNTNASTDGDDIILGGGAADASDSTLPGGYSSGTGTGSDLAASGVQLGTLNSAGTGPKLYSSGGNIKIKGQTFVSSSNTPVWALGLVLVSGTEVNSGVGKLSLSGATAMPGYGTNAWLAGIEFNAWGGAYTTKIISSNDATDAITVRSENLQYGGGSKITGGNSGTQFTNAAGGGLLIQVNSLDDGVVATLGVTGPIVIEPVSASFVDALNIDSGYTMASNPAGITLGKAGNTSAVTTSISLTSTGPIRVYGGNITATANLAVTNSNEILFKASEDILIGAGTNATTRRELSTFGGPITLWSNADYSGSGAVVTNNFNSFLSRGGKITMAGSASATETSPTGFAVGSASTTTYKVSTTDVAAGAGIRLGSSSVANNLTISSDGGDILIQGTTGRNTTNAMGLIQYAGSTIDAGTGAIKIDGRTTGTGTTINGHGIELGFDGSASTVITSAKPSADAIDINGQTSGTSTDGKGLNFWSGAATTYVKIAATGLRGNVKLTGSASTSSMPGVSINWARILSSSGTVTIDSGTNPTTFGASSTSSAVYLGADTAGGATGNIDINAGSLTWAGTVNARTTGDLSIDSGSSQSFASDLTIPTSLVLAEVSNVRVGTAGTAATQNTRNITISRALSAGGNIEVYGGSMSNSEVIQSTGGTISFIGSTFSNTASLSTDGRDITVTADQMTIGAALTANKTSSGIVSLLPRTSAKNIDLGASDSSTLLGLTNTELGFVTANVLRIGSVASANNVNVSAAISVAANKVPSFAIRANGNVTNSNSATISAQHLAISVNGTISLPGSNGITGNLALVAAGASAGSGVSFGTSGSYTADAVDSITPVFGIGKNISLSSAPAVGATEVRYLNQTWSAPPVVTVKDAYGYVISANNNKKTSYTTTLTGSGTPTIAGSTPVVSGGTQTFSALNFTSIGTTALTFSTGNLVAGGTSSVTTGTYDVQGGEPASLAITYDATEAPAGKTGFGIKVTLKDAGGNTVSGPHATDAITVDVSDGDSDSTNNAAVIAGGTPSTVAGQADFSTLRLSGKVGVTYTLTFTVTYVDSTSVTRTRSATRTVTLTPGDATKLKVQTPAAGFVNRTTFSTQPVIAVKDAYDNTIASAGTSVSVAVSAVGATSTQGLTGTLSATTNASGVATFVGVGKTGLVGTKRLTFSANNLTSDTQDFTLTYGAANKLAMTSPASTVNDTVFGTQPVVTIQDQDGNTVGDSTATVTLTSSNATIGGTLLNSAVAMNAVAGVANFDGKNVKLTGTIGARNLTATITGGITLTNQVTITYGAATKLFLSRDATDAVNGVAFGTQPIVVVQDISGNTVTNSTAAITVESSGSVLSGNSTPPTLANGVATFSGLKLTGLKGTYTLTYRSDGLTLAAHPITVAYGAATKLILTTAPLGFVNRTNFTTPPVITVQDASGNTVENSSISIDVAIDSGNLTGTTQIAAVNGVATFSGLGKNGTIGSKRLTFTKSGGGLTQAIFDFTLTYGAPTKLALTTDAADFVNRVAFGTQPVIEIQDADGNRVADSTASVTVAMTGGGTLDGTDTISAVGGVATFSGLSARGSIANNNVLAFTSSQLTGVSQASFNLTHGAAHHVYTTAGFNGTTSILSGMRKSGVVFGQQPKVAIVDEDNNLVSTGSESTQNVTVAADVTGLTGNTTVAAVGGLATYSGLTMTALMGNYTLTYTAATSGSTGTTPFYLSYGNASKLSLTTDADGFVNRTNFTTQPVVTVQDSIGNTVGDATISIDVAIDSGTLTGTTQVRSVAGVATFAGLGKYGTIGAKTLTFSKAGGGLTVDTQDFTLTFGAAHHITSVVSSSLVNDTVFVTQPVVKIRDQDENVVTDSTATVTLTSGNATIGGNLLNGAVAMDAVAGVADFDGKNVKLTGTIGAKTLTATVAGLTAVDSAVTITYGAATKLFLSRDATDAVNGVAFGTQPQVVVQDVSGNTVTNSTAIITVESSGSVLTGTSTPPTLANGVATFSGLTLTGDDNTFVLTYKSTGLVDAVQNITVSYGAATKLILTTSPLGFVNRTNFTTQPVITVQDASGNTVVNASMSIDVSSDTNDLTGSLRVNVINGIATFSGLGNAGLVGAKHLTFKKVGGGLTVATFDYTLTYGAVHHLSMAVANTLANNTAWANQPLVTIQDEDNNTVEINSTVTLTASGATTVAIAGTTTMDAVDGVANFTGKGVKLTGLAGSKTLTAAITAPGDFNVPATITLTYGAATKLALTTEPDGFVNRTNFTTQPIVTVQDVSGNTVGNSSISIDVSIDTGDITGTTRINAAGGVATFAGLGKTGTIGLKLLTFKDTAGLLTPATKSFTLTHGAAHHTTLAVASTLANNTEFATQPVVTIYDADNNVVTSGSQSTQTVTLTATGASTVTIGGAVTMDAADGIANFTGKGVKLTGLIGAKSLTATISSPSSIAKTETVTITYGAATKLAISTDAADASNGSAFGTQPVILVQDFSGNLVANSTVNVTASVNNGTLDGTDSKAAEGGVVTFTNLGLTATAGAKTLTFASTPLTAATQSITAVTGAPTSLRIDVANTLVNNTVFATQPVVTLLDSSGVVVSVGPNASRLVTLSSPDATIGGTVSMNAAAGVADFVGKGVMLEGIIGGRTLKASISSPSSVDATETVTITYGAAHHLHIASAASGIANRIAFTNQPAIEVRDISGNVVGNSTAQISVAATGTNGAVLGGDVTRTASSGIAYFAQNVNGLKLTGAVGAYRLTYSSGVLSADSQDVTLTHGTATKIVVSRSAASAKAGQAFGTQPKIQVQDADSNLVNTGVAATAQVRMTVSSDAYDSAAHTGVDLLGPANFETVTASAGEATFANARLEGVAATYTLKFETVNTTGFNGLPTSQTLGLTAGTETQLRVVQQPTAIIAGAAFSPTVTVEILDAWKNRVLDVASSVAIKPTLVDAAVLGNEIDASKDAVDNSSGLVTFTGLTFTKAGTQFIRFTTATNLTAATSSSFVITNAQAHHLTWVNATSTFSAKNDYAIKDGLNANPELEVRDQYENPVLTGNATTVVVTESTSSADVKAISGASVSSDAYARIAFANLVMRAKTGSYTLNFTAANASLPINGDVETATVSISHGDPSALRLTRNAAGANVDLPFTTQPKLNIEDTAGNVVADSSLAVTVSENVSQVLSGTTNKSATAGSVDFTDSGLKLSGTVQTGLRLKYAVTYNGTEISTSQDIDLDPGLAIDLTVGQQPTTVKTRVAFNSAPTVVLRDGSGNQVTSDNSSTVTAQLKDAGGNPIGSETAAFTASGGLVTFTGLSFQAPSTENYYVSFKLVSNGETVTSNAFDILPGVATELRITRQPSTDAVDHTPGKTGELLSTQPIAKLYDQDGNLVTTANAGTVSIRVKSTDGAGDLSEGTVTANVTGGIANFAGVKFVGTPGATYTLDFATATPNPTLTSLATAPISVTHNDATHLVVTRDASGGRSGMLFSTQPIITVKDRYENTVTTGPDSGADITATGEITAPTVGSTNPSNDTATASAGVATFQALGLTGSVANTYKLNFNVVGSNTISSASQENIAISYGSANHLTLTRQPAGGNGTGSHLATQPVVEVRDGAENLVANSVLNIAVTINSTAGLVLADGSAARLTGASKSAVGGIATFDALDLYGLPGTNYVLKFAVTGIAFATSNAIQVQHAAAHHLTITQQPTGGNATGASLAGQPTVQLRDAFENVVSSDSSDVITARLSTTSARERLEGNATVTLASGVGAFAGLKVVALPDTDYTLDFTTTIGGNTITSVATATFRVTYSTPTQLAVAQQPSGGTTGVALNTQPIIEVQDVYGNRIYNYVGNVAASVSGAASLTNSTVGNSSLSLAVTSGQAAFTGLAVTGVPLTDYQLTFASSGLTSVNSANIQVTPGAPVRIVILNQPVGAENRAALQTQPVVEIQDSFGNRVTQDSSTVITAALTSGADGTLTRVVSSNSVAIQSTVTNGVATFSNLYMRGLTNRNYRMTFSSGDLLAVQSANYSVNHAAVANLVWTTQPAVGMTGSPLTRAAVLELQDLDGNLADTDSDTVVTATVTTGVGGTLTSATAKAVNGVVTFTSLKLTGTPGTSYKLTFTGVIGSTMVSATESIALTPTHAVPNNLTMRGGNVIGGLSGENLTSQPTLYVRDEFGNIATSDNSTVVTAAILNDSTGSVSGNATATAVNGAVTFAGLKVSGTPGTPYTLRFTSGSLTPVNSTSFTVSKVSRVDLAYAAQAYSPNAIVPVQFSTDSPGDITFSTNASSTVCTLNRGTGNLTIKGVGNCLVRVDLDTSLDGFYRANYAEATLVISKAQQAPVTFTSLATVDYWSSLNPTAIGGTGTGALSYSVVSGSTCRLIGATILPGEAGSLCQITATRAGDDNYLPETSAVQTIEVRKINQATLTIASSQTIDAVDTHTLFTAGGSGTGAVTYSIVSSGTARCRIAVDVLTAGADGTCTIRATKAASTNYNAITSANQTVTVNLEEQTVAFTSTAPMFPVVSGSYTPSATATSGLAVTYSIATNNAGVACAFDGAVPGKINFTATGLCEVVATQAGTSRYGYASERQIIRVGLLNQTIAFDVIPDLAFGTPAFKLLPTTNAGSSAVVALATTSNSNACSISDGVVTLTAAGYCEIAANQSGYGAYAAATQVIRGFKVLADFAGAPRIFSSSVTTHALTASFTAPSYTGGSPIIGFALIATDANGQTYENAGCPVGASPITCTIVGLPNDVAYTAIARAITSAGRGAASNVTAAQTPKDAPIAVTNLTAATANNDLVVTWSRPTAFDGDFTRYDIFVAPVGSQFPETTPYFETDINATSTTIQNIINQSITPSPEPTETIAPARISFRRASVSSPSPSNSAPSNSSSAPAGYKVQIVTITSNSTVASNMNTANGTQTGFSVPLSPSQLTLTVTGNDLMTSWSAPTADGGSPVTGYDVKVNGSVICAATTSLFCEFTGMQPGRTYSVEVLAINAVGSSAASAASHSVAALPSGPGAGAANVSMPNGMTILGVSAKTALTSGGQLLTLNARNFAGVTSVTLEGKPVKIVSNSEDHITLELPAHEPGAVDLIFKSKIGTLVFQDAVTFIARPRADALQTFSRYRTNFVATNAKMVASIKAVVLAKEAPKAMVCVGLVPVTYTANDVKLAKIRAANVCAVGAKLDGNLAVRSTTGITKLTGPAARAVKVTYKY